MSGAGSGSGAGSLRAELLAGIQSHRREFEAAGDRAEELRTLPQETVQTLRSMGLFLLKTPEELGGTPLPPLEFCDVIEELAYVDVSTAWAAMIGCGCAGLVGGWLPADGVRRVFAADRPPPVIAGQLQPRGTGRPAEDGYLVSGRWSFASGIVHADWLVGAFRAATASRRLVSANRKAWWSSPCPRTRPRSSTPGTWRACKGPEAWTSGSTACSFRGI